MRLEKAPPFGLVPVEVASDPRLTLQQMRVLIALYTFRDKNTELARPSREEISERTGMALSKISTATTDLERLGWLTKVGNGGRSQATRYHVHVPKTMTESETVTESAPIPKQVTVTESETVTESARNSARIGNETVPESGRGKEQTIQTRTDQKEKRASAPATIPGIPDSLTADFLAVRKAKRAGPLTDTALAGIRREAEKAGLTLEQAITVCCENSWTGFNAGWHAERQQKRGAAFITGNTGETAYQRSMRERMQEAAPSIARKAPQPQQDAADYFRTVDSPARVVDVADVRAIGGVK